MNFPAIIISSFDTMAQLELRPPMHTLRGNGVSDYLIIGKTTELGTLQTLAT